MGHDPNGLITRTHFVTHKPGCSGAPPPLHVLSLNQEANHVPLPRPLPGHYGVQPGPALVGLDAQAQDNMGIDPTDPATWEGRGYYQSTGMIGRFNTQSDFGIIPMPGGQGVRPA